MVEWVLGMAEEAHEDVSGHAEHKSHMIGTCH